MQEIGQSPALNRIQNAFVVIKYHQKTDFQIRAARDDAEVTTPRFVADIGQ